MTTEPEERWQEWWCEACGLQGGVNITKDPDISDNPDGWYVAQKIIDTHRRLKRKCSGGFWTIHAGRKPK